MILVWEDLASQLKKLTLIYSIGMAYTCMGGNFSKSEFTKNTQLALSDEPEKWINVSLNLAKDHIDHYPTKYPDLQLDRLVINLGVWTINDGDDFPYGIYLSDFHLGYGTKRESMVDNQKILPKPEEKIWWLGKYFPFTHVAGEHRYIMGTKNGS